MAFVPAAGFRYGLPKTRSFKSRFSAFRHVWPSLAQAGRERSRFNRRGLDFIDRDAVLGARNRSSPFFDTQRTVSRWPGSLSACGGKRRRHWPTPSTHSISAPPMKRPSAFRISRCSMPKAAGQDRPGLRRLPSPSPDASIFLDKISIKELKFSNAKRGYLTYGKR